MPRGLNAYSLSEKDHFEYTTVMACGNAAGNILTPLIIYRNLPENIPNEFKSWDGPLYRSTKSGWINTELFNEWFVKIFIPESRRESPEYDGPIILIFNGHVTHLNDDFIELAHQYNIILLKLPSNTTHVLQPLDLNFFGPLKSTLARLIRNKYTGSISPNLNKEKFAEFLKESWNLINTSWLKKGFIISGICTENGINSNAITDDQIIMSYSISESYKKGLFATELNNDELEELSFPSDESRVEKITKQFMTMFQSPSKIPKRKISKYIININKIVINYILIAQVERNKRGSGYASLLVSTPTKAISISTFSPSPGKSPLQKKTKIPIASTSQPKSKKSLTTLIEAVPIEPEPDQFDHYCQFCLKKGRANIIWIQCKGGCNRWHHQKCTQEFKKLTKSKVYIYK
jgi:hypothetical protein